MIGYRNRIVDIALRKYLQAFGAVLITGPKWCGKTTTAYQVAKSTISLQDPKTRLELLKAIDFDPSLVLENEFPLLIDEWQDAPQLWDAVRAEVDKRQTKGLYILTGSTIVDETLIMHSGAGRIARLNMITMSLYESGESTGGISISDLIENPSSFKPCKSNLSIQELVFAACRGGWPSILNVSNTEAQLLTPFAYIDTICESEASTVDGNKKNPILVRNLIKSYARNIATLASNKTIMDDINANHNISEPTFYSYLNVLKKLYIISDITAWNPNIRSKTAIRSIDKKMFIDPSIAVAALGLTPNKLIKDLNTFGFIFENLCARDLKVYTSANRGTLSYYRDRSGLEADFVLHLGNGKYALIEVKLGSIEIEKAAKNLMKLQSLIKDNMDKKKPGITSPEALIILTGGEYAYRREDGVYIIPIGCLKE